MCWRSRTIATVLASVVGVGATTSTGLAQAISCDTPITATLSTPTEIDSYSFTFAAGEIVHISVDEIPPSDPNFVLLWRVVDASRNPASDCGSFTGAIDGDCGPLASGGNPYRIEVKEADGLPQRHVHDPRAAPDRLGGLRDDRAHL